MKGLYKYLFSLLLLFYAVAGKAQMNGPISFPLPPTIIGGPVVAAEYFWEVDPGLGLGTSIPVTQGADIQLQNLSLSIDTMATGVHHLYLRAMNAAGNWGHTVMHNFFIVPAMAVIPPGHEAAEVIAAEYFFDTDPGLGEAISLPVSPGADFQLQNYAIDISSLVKGVHTLYFRVKNAQGVWSHNTPATLFVLQPEALIPPSAAVDDIVAGEYFIDLDPGAGNGTPIALSVGGDVSADQIVVDISALGTGVHHLYTRVKNQAGRWSLNNVSSFIINELDFTIPPSAPVGVMTAIEYFFDTDPGFGNGHMLSITPTADLEDFQFAADLTGLQMDTVHTLYVRALDGWSMTTAATFVLGQSLPVTWVSFTGKWHPGGPVRLEWKTAMEERIDSYIVEKSVDGINFTPLHAVSAGSSKDQGQTHVYSYTDPAASGSKLSYRIKQVDTDGAFSYSDVITLYNSSSNASGFYVINNPVGASLRVHMASDMHIGQLQVYDMNGRLITTKAATKQAVQEIDVSRLPAGTYIVRFVNGQVQQSRRFIKR